MRVTGLLHLPIAWLLVLANSLGLLVPVLGFLALRAWDAQLIEQTERRLIAESVVVAELYRSELRRARGIEDVAELSPPPWAEDATYFPLEPILRSRRDGRVDWEVMPEHRASAADPDALDAGEAIQALLERVQLFNLAAIRVLDASGCSIAGTAGTIAECYAHLPEVAAALQGNYNAVTRPRPGRHQAPLGGPSRRGTVRVATALPIFEDGEIIAVVRMSRTAMDPLEAWYRHRQALFAGLSFCLLLMFGTSLVLWRAISRPVRRFRDAAADIAAGRERHFRPGRSRLEPVELVHLAEGLETMTARLDERARYIAEFAATASHELKTPITAIRGAAQLLIDSAEVMDEEQRARFLGNIDSDAARMQRLVRELLDLARIDHDIEGPPPEELELEPFLERLGASFATPVVVETTHLLGALRIRPGHLESALLNLLDNAVRHGGDGPIELRGARLPGRIALEVVDHGPGISEEEQERIFERFYTTARDHGGSGLGLAIVNSVATRWGGRVELESRPGKTVFRLVFPLPSSD